MREPLRRLPVALSALVVLGSVAVFEGLTALPAAAAPSITVTPSTGLSNGQKVTITGSGFTAQAIGNILECNDAPNIPTVALPSPVSASLSVGCTAPSYSHLATVAAGGLLSTTWTIETGTIGPPCGTSGAVITTCPSTDSAGKSPAADAANYPCPPTAAQQAAGVTCELTYGDDDNESASEPITFSGETTTTTSPTTTPTTQPQTTVTTSASSGSGGSSGSSATGSSATGSSTGSSGASSSASTGASAASSSGALPTTGPGRGVEWTALAGSVLVVLGGGGLVVGYQSRRRYAILKRR